MVSNPTTNLLLARPDFNVATWHDEINGNFTTLDSIFYALSGIQLKGIWDNNIAYVIGDRVLDDTAGVLYTALVNHTSASVGTFAADRTANPTFWEVSTVTTTDADNVIFDPAGALSSTNVQAAIEELDAEKQPLDADLTSIAALTPTNDDIIQRKLGVWTNRTIAQLLVDLAAPGTTFQPLDSDLTAIASLTTTAYGRAFLELANEAGFKAAVNLEIGVDVQAFNLNLDTWASINPSANVQSLVSAADYAAMRALLDLEAGTDFYSITAANAAFQPLDSDLTSIAALTTTNYGRALLELADAAALTALSNAFVGDSGAGGTKGLVPAPVVGDATKFLRGDGSFVTIPGGGDLLSTNNLSDVASAEASLANLGGAPVGVGIPQGRLTLETGVPVSTTDQLAKTTLYYTPYTGNKITLYVGGIWVSHGFSELSLSLAGLTANSNFDIFAYSNSGVVTLEALIWTNDTTRATALARQDGVPVKSGDATRRYLGTFRTTGTTGQTEYSFGGASDGGTAANLFLWNMYNRVDVVATTYDTTDTWTYNTDAWRDKNNSTGNRVNLVVGQKEDYIKAENVGHTFSSTGVRIISVGINSSTVKSGMPAWISAAFSLPMIAKASVLAEGYIFLAPIERTQTATGTFYGDNGGTVLQTGFEVSIRM